MQGPSCVVYSFGSNGELTFEEALIRATHGRCEVHVFDFSVSDDQAQQAEQIEGVKFHRYGISETDQHVSEPFTYEDRSVPSYELKSLPSIMRDLGHKWIDVLKMDVEGAEYSVLQSIVQHYKRANQTVPITQAQIEYHQHDKQPTRQDLIATLTAFEKSGFRAFHSEYNYRGEPWHYIEFAYLHVDDNGKVVTMSL